MAIGLVVWSNIKSNKLPHVPFYTFANYKALQEFVRSSLSKIPQSPKILIIGGKGRVGSGSAEFARFCNLEPEIWDVEHTSGKEGPFDEILSYDIFVNTILLSPSNKSKFLLIDQTLLQKKRKLSVIVDISCDPYNPANPMPIYSSTTDFNNPTHVISTNPRLELIAIDHLPSLVPEESSREFADSLLPHLGDFDKSIVWKNAKEEFHKHL